MTIAERNKSRLIIISIMSIIAIASILIAVFIFLYRNLNQYFFVKNSFFQNFILTKYTPYIIILSTAIIPVLSTIFLIFIYKTFKKTHSLEMSFFVAFIFAIGFESIKLIFPIYKFYGMPISNISLLSRCIYLGRLFSLFSLFLSSIFAIKTISRRISSLMFFLFFISFLLSISLPVNNINMNSFFMFGENIFQSYKYILAISCISTVINYFLAYIIKNSKEYLKATFDIILLITGYWVLIYTASIAVLILGLSCFIIGTIRFIKNIHHYHLWE